MLIRIILSVLFLCSMPYKSFAAVCSNPISYSDGAVLTAAQLNSSFNTIYSCANTIDNSNLTSTANILPIKLDPTIADDGIGRNGTTGVLSVNVDTTSIEITGDTLQIKDSGVTTAKIADSNVTTAKIADSNVTTAKIADGAVTAAKKVAINEVTDTDGGQHVTSTSYGSAFLTQSITTTRSVIIVVQGNTTATSWSCDSSTSNCGARIKIMRDGTTINEQQMQGIATGSFDVPLNLVTYDSPTPGVHTYTVSLRATVAGHATDTGASKMFISEL